MATVYKIEIMVIDFEKSGEQDIRDCLESCKYVNPTVVSMESREVEWSDDHPLNKHDTSEKAYQELFGN